MIDYEKDLMGLQGNNETVLIVEDYLSLRVALREMLAENGYRVLEATDPGEAMTIFDREKDIRIVISDLSLPEISGLELLEKMKNARPGIRAILASGFVEDEQKGEMERKGIDLFLQKPYTPLELLTKVRKALGAH